MDKLQETIAKILGDEIILLDVKEDLHNHLVKIVVDSELPVTVDLTAALTKAIRKSGQLESFYPDGYRLEVSSPGVGTPLTYPFQFRKNVGRKLTLTVQAGEATETFKAVLREVQDNGILVDQEPLGERYFDYGDIVSAKVVLEFN
jgi:ribosome maturation factor RimP